VAAAAAPPAFPVLVDRIAPVWANLDTEEDTRILRSNRVAKNEVVRHSSAARDHASMQRCLLAFGNAEHRFWDLLG
jgi:hypothetical protein